MQDRQIQGVIFRALHAAGASSRRIYCKVSLCVRASGRMAQRRAQTSPHPATPSHHSFLALNHIFVPSSMAIRQSVLGSGQTDDYPCSLFSVWSFFKGSTLIKPERVMPVRA